MNNLKNMKTRLLCAIVLVASTWSFAAVAQETAVEVLRSGIPHDSLYAIDMTDDRGLAVGNYGLMLETQNGGESWELSAPETKLALFAIATSGENQIVVGQSGTVLTRVGDGDWVTVESGFTQRLLSVAMNTSGITVAVGEFGFIGLSDDAGNSWRSTVVDWEAFNEEGYEPHLYDAVVEEDGSILIVGEFGLVLPSTDGGKSFSGVVTGDQSLFDIHMAEDGTSVGYVVGQEGFVGKTMDNGHTWQTVEVPSSSNLLGVWSGHGEVVITGIRTMLRSSDDGQSFTGSDDVQIVRTWYQGIDSGVSGADGSFAEQNVYVVGHEGSIARVTQ